MRDVAKEQRVHVLAIGFGVLRRASGVRRRPLPPHWHARRTVL
jgi:hypothetical protein